MALPPVPANLHTAAEELMPTTLPGNMPWSYHAWLVNRIFRAWRRIARRTKENILLTAVARPIAEMRKGSFNAIFP